MFQPFGICFARSLHERCRLFGRGDAGGQFENADIAEVDFGPFPTPGRGNPS